MVEKGKRRKMPRITDADIRDVHAMAAAGMSNPEIARQKGMPLRSVERCKGYRLPDEPPRPASTIAPRVVSPDPPEQVDPLEGPDVAAPDAVGSSPAQGVVVPPIEQVAPLAPGEQKLLLTGLARALGDMAQSAARAHDHGLALSYTRQALAVHEALRKLPSEQDDETGIVKVPVAQMRERGERARAKLQDYLERELEVRATWPRCATCGRPVRPKEEA